MCVHGNTKTVGRVIFERRTVLVYVGLLVCV